MPFKKVQLTHPYQLELEIIRFENEYAILHNSERGLGEVRWPKEKLPLDAKIGSKVHFSVTNNEIEEENHYIVMRKLLEEIVN